MENIGLQDSLLSRFDLIFVILDNCDMEQDNIIADHVLRMHRYRPPNEADGEVLPFGSEVDALTTEQANDAEKDIEDDIQIYDKYDAVLHGPYYSKKYWNHFHSCDRSSFSFDLERNLSIYDS